MKAKSEIKAVYPEMQHVTFLLKKWRYKANGAPNTQSYVQESSSIIIISLEYLVQLV